MDDASGLAMPAAVDANDEARAKSEVWLFAVLGAMASAEAIVVAAWLAW